MIMTPGAIYTNLDNWNFSTLGPYKVDEMQAESIKKSLSLTLKKRVRETVGDLKKGIPTTYSCPLCFHEINPDWKCCPNCGQWLIRKQEKKSDEL